MATAEQTVSAVLDATNKRYVVETGQTESGWFTRYSDGWIEQGGTLSFDSEGYMTGQSLVFPIEFSSLEYSIVFCGSVTNAATVSNSTNNIGSRTTSGVTYVVHFNNAAKGSWLACGY